MFKRLFSTCVLWAGALGIPYYFGATGGVWMLAILSLLTQYELYGLLQKTGFRPQKGLGCFLGLVFVLSAWYMPENLYFENSFNSYDVFTMSVIVTSLTVLVNSDFTKTKYNIMPTLLGLLLVPYMLHFYVLILKHFELKDTAETGLFWVLWLVAVPKLTDVGGLCVGSLIGRHKLAHAISPGKTWEGAFGGILAAVCTGAFLSWLFKLYIEVPETFSPVKAGLWAILIAILSIASDLIESVLKRKAGVKDSGNLIPGIGGAFDLTDSLLLTAPCGYLIFKMILF